MRTQIHERRFFGIFCLLAVVAITACASQPISTARISDGKLAPCSSAPRCVNSDDPARQRQIPALQINGDAAKAWAALKIELDKLPRARTVEDRDDYRHVIVTTRLLRFKDDVEFLLRADRGEIAIRSSSNVGYYDFNTNRNRLEAIRTALRDQGVIK